MAMTRKNRWMLTTALMLGLGVSAAAESLNEAIQDHVLYGIDRETAALKRYAFYDGNLQEVGLLRTSDHRLMQGVDAAAYFPGYVNLFALWQDDADAKNKLVYVNVQDATTTIMHDDVEGGRFTGATALVHPSDGHTVYAVQVEKVQPPARIQGVININPNNASDMEFLCEKPDGAMVTRDDLHADSPMTGNGDYYVGQAVMVRVRPKGNGNQNGLIINGEPFDLRNSNTYTFEGQMQVRIYNDKPKNGKAMGHWWIEITDGTVSVNNHVQVLSPHRLVKLDHRTGEVTELMTLSRAYRGLTTLDGQTFLTAHRGTQAGAVQLYRLDLAAGSEQLLGAFSSAVHDLSDLGYAGSYLLGYDVEQARIVAIHPDNVSLLASPLNLGTGLISPIMLPPVEADIFDAPRASYD